MNVSTVLNHYVQAYGFALCRNLEVTDAFQVDHPPIIKIIQSYGTIGKKRAVEYRLKLKTSR